MNLTLHDVDRVGIENANAKLKQKSVVTFCSFLRDGCRMVRNSKNSKDSNADLTASNANVLQKKNGHVESNDRSQVHAEEEGKRDTVFDLL